VRRSGSDAAYLNRADCGYTLLELLVVLVIVGLISAVAVPQLSTLSDRVELALNREKNERALNCLPYEAYKRHEDFVLGVIKEADFGEDTSTTTFRMQNKGDPSPLVVEAPVLLTPAPITLPKGWLLEMPTPVIYRATGMCTGGDVNLKVGALVYAYQLAAPQCQPRLK